MKLRLLPESKSTGDRKRKLDFGEACGKPGPRSRGSLRLELDEIVLVFGVDDVRARLEVALDRVRVAQLADEGDGRALSLGVRSGRLRVEGALEVRVRQTVAGRQLRGRVARNAGGDSVGFENQHALPRVAEKERAREPDDARADHDDVGLVRPFEPAQLRARCRCDPVRRPIGSRRLAHSLFPPGHGERVPRESRNESGRRD